MASEASKGKAKSKGTTGAPAHQPALAPLPPATPEDLLAHLRGANERKYARLVSLQQQLHEARQGVAAESIAIAPPAAAAAAAAMTSSSSASS